MTFELAPLFQAVGAALRQNQPALNQADSLNGNHGDHMVEIFDLAARAARDYEPLGMAQAMLHASQLLQQTMDNGSAQVYARGLACLAQQFQRQEIELPDLVFFIQKSLAEDKDALNESQENTAASSGKTLKTLLTGLAAWSQSESGQPISERPLDMGALFEFGMAYMQAKQRGGSRVEVLSDAAAAVSPLGSVPHRYQSGKLAIQALLQAIQQAGNTPQPGSAWPES